MHDIFRKSWVTFQVYEDNSAAIRIPESISSDSNMLLLGFPDCGSSYFLLMQLDKDFKPQFKLLEICTDSSGKYVTNMR